jgi:hypothetical protein
MKTVAAGPAINGFLLKTGETKKPRKPGAVLFPGLRGLAVIGFAKKLTDGFLRDCLFMNP